MDAGRRTEIGKTRDTENARGTYEKQWPRGVILDDCAWWRIGRNVYELGGGLLRGYIGRAIAASYRFFRGRPFRAQGATRESAGR